MLYFLVRRFCDPKKMMKVAVLLALIGFAAAQNKFQGKFVWDLLKPALTAEEIQTLVTSRDVSFPMLHDIPDTGFNCASKAQPGFYADQEAQCQVFHRCDQEMNMTSYLCVNSTLFNQITLVCDSWYNVDCEKSKDFENFANSRLYTNLPLFDTPPADYIAPSQLVLMHNQGVAVESKPILGKKPIRGQQGSIKRRRTTTEKSIEGGAQEGPAS